MEDRATDRVAVGASILDEARPGWWEDVDTGTLDMTSYCGCIIGQEARIPLTSTVRNTTRDKWMDEVASLAPFVEAEGIELPGSTEDLAIMLGFDADTSLEYSELRELWVEAINDRQRRNDGKNA